MFIKTKAMGKYRGFSLINVMLLLSALAFVSALQFRDQSVTLQYKTAENAGKHMAQLNGAVGDYLVTHANALRKMQDNECAGLAGCTPTVEYCRTGLAYLTVNQCELDYNRLIAEGYLPPGWLNINPWGSAYTTIIMRVPKPYVNLANPGVLRDFDFNLRAITVTRAPWIDVATGQPLLGYLGRAVESGGADLALTITDANIANGLVRREYDATLNSGTQVSWNADASMNPYISAIGVLVSRAGFEASGTGGDSEYLLRDGGNAMRGNLNLGDQRINNVQDASIGVNNRNLAAAAPTWVFKYSYRVGTDGATVPKPDCRAPSGGWTNRGGVPIANPWDSAYSNGSTVLDVGEPRILLNMDTMKNVRALGYSSTGSSPATDPYIAEQNKLRAAGSYQFFAEDNGVSWSVFMRYYQDVQGDPNASFNAASDRTNSQGVASVYCYFDNKIESACNNEPGCRNNGTAPAGAMAPPDLDSPPSIGPGDMAPYQDPSAGAGGNGGGNANPGARDVIRPLGG